ncbi:HD-GYP domain-containing protein [bacterium]|nr:HD-GYP domain-containing protein [bacterium]
MKRETVRVAVDRIKPGWVADHDIFLGTQLLIAKGTSITAAILRSLKSRNIDHVDVKEDSVLAESRAPAQADAFTEVLASTREIYSAHKVEQAVPEEFIDKATDELEHYFDEIEMGQKVEVDTFRPLVRQMVGHFTKNPSGAVKLLDLDSFDRYTYRHSLNVGLLYMLVVQDWCDTEDELHDLVLGAVLHDLGKIRVGTKIINKQGKLTEAEMTVIRMHPVWSVEMLEGSGVTKEAISIARSHHERLDGKGYPDGLKGGEIDRYARLAAVCDVYDALTSTRSYKRKMEFAVAIDLIVRSCGDHFDPDIANMFISRLGRYPVGSIVRLSSGEAAVVLRINEHAISRPVVSRVSDADGSARDEAEELDLSEREDIHITGVVTAPDSTTEIV